MRVFLFWCAMLCIPASTSAQTYNFKNLTIENGLPQSYVQVILQDKEGYVWMGTADGLSRYDGKKFITYTYRNGLADNYVVSGLVDINGTVWFGHQGGGVSRYIQAKDSFEIFTPINRFTAGIRISCMFEDHEGNIWFGSFGYGALVYDGKKITQYNEQTGFHIKNIFGIAEDRKGRIWLASTEGLFYKDGTSFRFQKGFPTNDIYSIISDKTGNLWIGTLDGVVMVPAGLLDENDSTRFARNLVLLTKKDGLAEGSVISILEDSQNNLWFGTYGQGVSRYVPPGPSRREGYFKNYNTDNGLAYGVVWSLFEDSEKNIWIGTLGGGVSQFRFNDERFESFTTKDGLINGQVWAIVEDRERNMWFGTDDGIMRISFTGESRKITGISHFDFAMGHGHNKVLCIFQDENGVIWTGREGGGLCKLEPGKKMFECIMVEADEPTGKISSIIRSDDGKLILGTYGGVVLLNTVTGDTTHINSDDGLNKEVINSVYADSKGTVWIASEGGGLSSYKNGKVENFDESSGMKHSILYCISEDAAGNMWFGTQGGGIYLYDGKKFTSLTTKDGLSSDNVYSITGDNDNNIWMGTSSGIDRYDPKSKQFAHYGKAEGFLGGEANLNAICRDLNGNLWFGTINGVVKYNPRKNLTNPVEPRTYITAIKLFQRDTVSLSTAELNYKQSHLTFEFIGISLSYPENVSYQYKLEGFDPDWLPITGKNDATYSNLQPGEYTFMVKACNSDGVWNETPAQYHFVITPPFWRTTWFYMLCAVVVVASVYTYIRIRTANLERAKKILEEQVEERTAEVVQQKQEIEQKNKDITDSINYAKRIQLALLPVRSEIEKRFRDSFVFFRPRDIVSGDFYWFSEQDGKIIVATVDCTGHGVPGAFMSIVGNTALNEIVNEKNTTEPSEILLQLDEKVTHTLKQSAQESETRDGMDVAVCVFDKGKKEVRYAGANRPLLHIRNNELTEIKGNNFPIGGFYEEAKKFTTRSILLQEGDTIYMSSDGYADQFGGPSGKKFMTKQFKHLIKEIQNLDMNLQEQKIRETIDAWRGRLEQVDDILVMGFRI